VCLQVKLCDPHLSALEVRFSRRGAIQIYVYLTLPNAAMGICYSSTELNVNLYQPGSDSVSRYKLHRQLKALVINECK